MRWTVKKLNYLKNTTLVIASIIILLYLILSLIESTAKLITLLILLPVIIWAFIAWKYPKQAAIMAFLIAFVTIIWFAIDFLLLRTQRVYWHIPIFILIAPLPAIIVGYILWFYYDKRKS